MNGEFVITLHSDLITLVATFQGFWSDIVLGKKEISQIGWLESLFLCMKLKYTRKEEQDVRGEGEEAMEDSERWLKEKAKRKQDGY